MLSENPIEEGTISQNSILAEIKRKKEQKLAELSLLFQTNHESDQSNFSDDSELSSEEKTSEQNQNRSKKVTSAQKTNKNEKSADNSETIVIGNKRIKIKNENKQNNSMIDKNKNALTSVFKNEEGAVEMTITKSLQFDDILNNSLVNTKLIRTVGKNIRSEVQLMYELLNLVKCQKSLWFESLQTGQFSFEILQKSSFSLENLPESICKKVLSSFFDLSIKTHVLQKHLEYNKNTSSQIIQVINCICNQKLADVFSQIGTYQKIIVYQVMMSGNESKFFLDNENITKFKRKTLTLLWLQNLLNQQKEVLEVLTKIYSNAVSTKSEHGRAVCMMNYIHSLFEMCEYSFFFQESKEFITDIFSNLILCFLKDILSKFLNSQLIDFEFIGCYSIRSNIDEKLLLENFFENKCFFEQKKFPIFFKKHFESFFKIFCTFLIYKNLFDEFSFELNDYKLPQFYDFGIFNDISEISLRKRYNCCMSFSDFVARIKNAKSCSINQQLINQKKSSIEKEQIINSGLDNLINDQTFLSSLRNPKVEQNIISAFCKKELLFEADYVLDFVLPSTKKEKKDYQDIKKWCKCIIETGFPDSIQNYKEVLNKSVHMILNKYLHLKKTFQFFTSFYFFLFFSAKTSEKWTVLFEEV